MDRVRRFFASLDAYATDERGFCEGHPEDRCPLCGRPVGEHPMRWPGIRMWAPAKWAHRRTAALALANRWWDRVIDRVA